MRASSGERVEGGCEIPASSNPAYHSFSRSGPSRYSLPHRSFADARLAWRNAAFRRTSLSETPMNEEAFNLSIRKFLKMVGVSSQREIEQAVARAIAAGAISGTESFPAKVTLEVAGLKLSVDFDGEITLQ
jgi:hypothetical protein